MAALLVGLGMTSSAFAIDLSGDYVGFTIVPFTVKVMQTGTVLHIGGHVIFGEAEYQFSADGTVDPSTGALSVTGEIVGLCQDFAFDGTGDGEELRGSAIAHCGTTQQGPGPFRLSKCGNGLIDPLESCDATAGIVGDCCSTTSCRPVPAGGACPSDGNECTQDVCDATGTCMHLPVPRATCRRCNGTCRRDIARCMATQCEKLGRAECRRMCKPPAIRTLAYAMSECRVDSGGLVVTRQALRIRRGDRDAITVVEFPSSPPMPDPDQLCSRYSSTAYGGGSVVFFPLQRLGVSPDGSGIVFEVNDEFSRLAPSRLAPEQKGFFYVRSDGQKLRRLGPPSRHQSFQLGQNFINGGADFGAAWVLSPQILFSPNGRWIAFTDRAPGPQGEDAIQIVALDLATGERRLLTQLPSEDGIPQDKLSAAPTTAPYLPTCCPKFIDNETILFQTFVDPVVDSVHLNPEHDFTAFTVKIDGSGLKTVAAPALIGLPDSHLVPSFAVVGQGANLVRLSLAGTPVYQVSGFHFPISEVFLQTGKNMLQLTNLGRADTFLAFMNPARTRAFFLASADPGGTNPDGYCQIFSVDALGGGQPRQLTHLDSGVCRPLPGPVGCFHPNGIGYGYYRLLFQDPITQAVVFDTNCDPLGSNGNGYQLFAMRPDGTGLRQLTDATGVTLDADGGTRVELPGPFAYSAALH